MMKQDSDCVIIESTSGGRLRADNSIKAHMMKFDTMPVSNVYGEKPNKEVLEKQREIYIQREISELLTSEGANEINVAVNESGAKTDEEVVDVIIGLIEGRLTNKKIIDECPKDVIYSSLKNSGSFEFQQWEEKNSGSNGISSIIKLGEFQKRMWRNTDYKE